MEVAGSVSFDRIGHIAVLRLARPERRNALDGEMRSALAAAIELVRRDAEIRAVVLTGSGGCFCAGGDVRGMASMLEGERDIFEGRTRITEMHRWMEDLIDLEKPVIAAVDGVAFGAGLSLTLAADYVLCSPAARFCAVFARVGYVPDLGAMYLLPRRIGIARAKDLAFTAREVDAAEALEIGLVERIVEGDLEGEAIALAQRLSAAPTEVVGIVKSVMNRSFESERAAVLQQEAMAQAMCREGAFHAEAVRRFVAKEPLQYVWKDND